MWGVRVLMWGFWMLMCDIAYGAPIYHHVDWGAKVKWEKKSRTLRHLGHQHQVIYLVAEENLQQPLCFCVSVYLCIYL